MPCLIAKDVGICVRAWVSGLCRQDLPRWLSHDVGVWNWTPQGTRTSKTLSSIRSNMFLRHSKNHSFALYGANYVDFESGVLGSSQILLGPNCKGGSIRLIFDENGILNNIEHEPDSYSQVVSRQLKNSEYLSKPIFIQQFSYEGELAILDEPAGREFERIGGPSHRLYNAPPQFDEYLRCISDGASEEFAAPLRSWASQPQYILRWQDRELVIDDQPSEAVLPVVRPPTYRYPIFFDDDYASYSGVLPDGRFFLLSSAGTDRARVIYFADRKYQTHESIHEMMRCEGDLAVQRLLTEKNWSVQRIDVQQFGCDGDGISDCPDEFAETIDIVNHPEGHPDVPAWLRYLRYLEFRSWYWYGRYYLVWGNELLMNGDGIVEAS